MDDTVIIDVRFVTKHFNGSRVLDGISFSVAKGEVFGFLGPNGAGKTTTLRILLGLMRPDSGEALVLGNSLDTADEVRSHVGVLFENNGLVERFTARENLLFYAELYNIENPGGRVDELLGFTGLGNRGDDLVGTFSTGMKRKLGLARAILHDPEILFLDEPSSGLDPEGQRMVHDLILDLSGKRSMTIFLNSHNLEEVSRVCSKVAILHRGVIRAYDTVDHLRTGPDGTEMEITLHDAAEATKAIRVLSGMEGAGTVRQVDDRHVTVFLHGDSGFPVLRELVAREVVVEEIKRRKRSLEEIYLDTVRQAEGDSAESAKERAPGILGRVKS
ncbi:MAG TPA: ABC transporter ATP-binding protein [Methanoregulaceae archaeon]|nr:ABC transporter ATP-binding protein [Methanoregulaceae archaeon]